MRILLDTHTFLWFIEGNPRVSPLAIRMIEDRQNDRLLSYISLWEIAIKASIGKLPLHEPFETLIPSELRRNRIDVVGITIEHLNRVIALPLHHRDPFDRMLVAQAMVEGVPILGADENFDAYGVQRLW